MNPEKSPFETKEKPEELFHGSAHPDMEQIEPRKRFVPAGEDKEATAEAVYAGDDPAFAAAHAFPWTTDEGFRLSFEGSSVIFEVPVQYKERLMQKTYVYTIPSDSFVLTHGEGTGHTYHTTEEVETANVEEFETVEEAIEHYGGKVVYY